MLYCLSIWYNRKPIRHCFSEESHTFLFIACQFATHLSTLDFETKYSIHSINNNNNCDRKVLVMYGRGRSFGVSVLTTDLLPQLTSPYPRFDCITLLGWTGYKIDVTIIYQREKSDVFVILLYRNLEKLIS